MKSILSGVSTLKDLLLTWKHGKAVDNSHEWLQFQSTFGVNESNNKTSHNQGTKS